jgi:hypothetical protein
MVSNDRCAFITCSDKYVFYLICSYVHTKTLTTDLFHCAKFSFLVYRTLHRGGVDSDPVPLATSVDLGDLDISVGDELCTERVGGDDRHFGSLVGVRSVYTFWGKSQILLVDLKLTNVASVDLVRGLAVIGESEKLVRLRMWCECAAVLVTAHGGDGDVLTANAGHIVISLASSVRDLRADARRRFGLARRASGPRTHQSSKPHHARGSQRQAGWQPQRGRSQRSDGEPASGSSHQPQDRKGA